MNNPFDVLIAGAGHGGATAAATLRQSGFAGSIGLVGAEPDLPYERPPLSKTYLKGATSFENMLLRPAGFWAENKVALHQGTTIAAIDPAQRRAATADGQIFAYGTLIWAAGGTPRRLGCEGDALAGVHAIRTRADVDRLALELPGAEKIVVVGGGYIGLEAAAALTALGKQVTVLEAQDRVLARVAGETLSRFYEAEHRRHGVTIRLGAKVRAIRGQAGRATGLELEDGAVLPADMVIVGIGIVPEIQVLQAAGAVCGNGVHIDAFCATSLSHVYAIGDCAAQENQFAGGARIRLESVQNATDQGRAVGRSIAGQPERYAALPWFWSDQFDLRLQTAGLSHGHDAAITRGDPATRSFSVIYLRAGRVIALDCVNAARDFVPGRMLIQTCATPPASALADTEVPLKSLL
jgi:3-phenylpropionate/trans-cinnamate dioxygenase ferredoxin reductase subunit